MTIIVWVVMDYDSHILIEHGVALDQATLEARYEAEHGHPLTEDGLQSVQATIMT
jgi:hypothetical protein